MAELAALNQAGSPSEPLASVDAAQPWASSAPWNTGGLSIPPQVDPEVLPGHSPLVPTVPYRGRQSSSEEVPPGAESPQVAEAAAVLPTPTQPGGEGTTGWTASGTGLPQTADETAQGDQWHHKASSALGFHRPKHHLTKRETAGVIVLAVLLLAGITLAVLALTGNLGRARDQTPTPEPSAPTAAPGEPAPGEAGATEWSLAQSFRQGDFILVIDSYQDALPALADPGSEVAENGQWALFGITVKNAGDQDGTFLPDQQILVTDKGTEYPDEPASALKHADFVLGTSPIKPGGSQRGFLAFDIPLEEKPVELRFIGRIGEPAVTVPLG
ncbi:MAG: DUF4352 domain-containing protein [Bifidobacteriaceae bacterium]|nr:DUF4352 domain-containing protein [Bifidobacteriaceae bacterium]